MELRPGQRLLQYRLEEPIGEGGMGVVWRATDTALDRSVAIKVLPVAVAQDATRLARFEREARLLASLNHPNIATIHGLHEVDGVHFLALELIDGEDLSAQLAQGSLSTDQALRLARQIADGLNAAHDAGVVHRDLKPANIRVTPDGAVRILDFGLAKALDSLSPDSDASGAAARSDPSAPTMTSMRTVAGMILGTAAYMSPEQARGKLVDRRADMWAFGCVLYEMLSGRHAFAGETVSDTLASILRSEPDWSALPADTPHPVLRLLRRCLAKDPTRRLSDIGDARFELDDALEVIAESSAAGHSPVPGAIPVSIDTADGTSVRTSGVVFDSRSLRARTIVQWLLIAALGAISLIAISGWLADPDAGAGAAAVDAHLSIVVPPELELMPGNVGGLRIAVSRDGSRVAFSARERNTVQLFLRELDSDRVVRVPESRGASEPFFSPDGRWVGFFAQGLLKKVAVGGGTPIVLAEARTSRGGVWLSDDTIVYAPSFDSGLWRVPAAGGEPVQLTAPDRDANERTHRWPDALPGDTAIVFTIGTLDNPGDYEDATIAAVTLDDGRIEPLIRGATMARHVGDRLVYTRTRTLLAVPFDADALALRGEPRTVLTGVDGEATSGAADYAFSADGSLFYIPALAEPPEPELVRVDRDGRAETLPLDGIPALTPRLSPDDTRLALTLGRGLGDGDLYVYDLDGRRSTRLTFDGAAAVPIWSADGRRLTYGHTLGGAEGVRTQPIDGSGSPELYRRWAGSTVLFPDAWLLEGETLVATIYGGVGGADVIIVPRDGESTPLLGGPDAEGGLSFAPSRDWFAYASDESGQFEVYVQPYPGPGGTFQISADGGKGPVWSRAGDEIFYTSGDDMMAVPVRTAPTFSAGEPSRLFGTAMHRALGPWPDFDATRDGRTFYYFRRPSGAHAPRRIDVRFGFAGSIDDE